MTKTAMQLLSERLRAQQEASTQTKTKSGGGDNASYPFWTANEGSSASVRFLPDGNSDNPDFWVNRQIIKLPFDGQVGGDYPTDDQVTVTVPCMDMYVKNSCPIIAHTRPWWKQGPEKEALAKQYYKKQSYLFQGFVINSPFEEENKPENPIRRFVINPSIYKIIYESLANPEFEDIPTDFTGGREFTIRKTRQGDYANYGTSGWSFRTRSLNDSEMNSMEQFGLFNLGDFVGNRPDADGVAMIKAMFLDSLEGKPFDFDSYGSVYRAYGKSDRQSDPDAVSTSSAAKTSSTTRVASAPKVVEKVAEVVTETVSAKAEPEVVTPTTSTAAAPADVLARIRAIAKEKAAAKAAAGN